MTLRVGRTISAWRDTGGRRNPCHKSGRCSQRKFLKFSCHICARFDDGGDTRISRLIGRMCSAKWPVTPEFALCSENGLAHGPVSVTATMGAGYPCIF